MQTATRATFDSDMGDDDLDTIMHSISDPTAARGSAAVTAPGHGFATLPSTYLASPIPAARSTMTRVQVMNRKLNALGAKGLDSKVKGCHEELQRLADYTEGLQ